ncbi:pentatricopeptide repeat-containing protein [Tanacetum coccineum]
MWQVRRKNRMWGVNVRYAQGNRACEAVEVTMVALLSACAQLGALELGEWDQCVITWTTVIAGLALHGLGKEALDIFSRMEKSRVKPNDVTLIAVLSACSHSGLVKSGRWYFNNLLKKYGIKPRIEHYGCMIDLLGRAGCLLEAQEVLKQMPFEPNAAIWGSLLAASRLYKNVDLGQKALDHLVKLEPHNSGNFSLLSNLYAADGHWNESGSIRKAMRDNGVKKISGASCIEVNSRVHEFISGNGSRPLPESISEVLSEVLEAKTVEVLKVGTEHNDADALTKVVPGHKLQHCLELLSVGIG